MAGVGGIVLKTESIAFGRIRATVRHPCGHAQTLVVQDRNQALRAAERVCERCAPPPETAA